MSRIDDLKKQNPQLDISLIDLLSSADPSKTNKYLGFLLKVLKGDGNETLNPTEVKEFILHSVFGDELYLLKRFEDHCTAQRIKNPDISKLKSFDEIDILVYEADKVMKQRELEKQVIKLYDENDFLVLIPLSYEASASYGSNTKWCITQEDTWKDYWGEYRLIFIIDKINNVKYAISIEIADEENIQCWEETDDEINPIFIPLPEQVLTVLRTELKKHKFETEVEYLGSDKILTSDKGIVNIEDATLSDLENYFKFYGYNLTKKEEENLKKKIKSLGGTYSENEDEKIIDTFKTYGDYTDGLSESGGIWEMIKKNGRHETYSTRK